MRVQETLLCERCDTALVLNDARTILTHHNTNCPNAGKMYEACFVRLIEINPSSKQRAALLERSEHA